MPLDTTRIASLGGAQSDEEPHDMASRPCGRNFGVRWIVVETHPQAERRAARDIGEKGYRAYLPMQVARRRDRAIKTLYHTVHVPMFGGYLFVELDLERDPWTPIRYADGVRQVFMTLSQRPIPVPVGFVEGLIDSAAERLSLPDDAMPRIPIGSPVTIIDGPMEGHAAVCRRCDGVTTEVEVSLFGRPMALTMKRSAIAAS